jgi:hypothetical protein
VPNPLVFLLRRAQFSSPTFRVRTLGTGRAASLPVEDIIDYSGLRLSILSTAFHVTNFFFEKQELVVLPFIRLANRQSSSMEYTVFLVSFLGTGRAASLPGEDVIGCGGSWLSRPTRGARAQNLFIFFLENQELVALLFIRLANRQSSSVEYAVFLVSFLGTGWAAGR